MQKLSDAVFRIVHWQVLLPVTAVAGGTGFVVKAASEPAYTVAAGALALLAARAVADFLHVSRDDEAVPVPAFTTLTDTDADTPIARSIMKLMKATYAADNKDIEKAIASRIRDLRERREYFNENPSERRRVQEEIKLEQKKLGMLNEYYASITPRVIGYFDLSLQIGSGPFRAPLSTAAPQAIEAFSAIYPKWIYSKEARECGAFNEIRAQININREAIALRETKGKSDSIFINEYEGSNTDKLREWLRNTDLQHFFLQEVPYGIENEIRYAGMHIVAPPRRGKTQALQAMIMSDLELVERGEASIVVMNSDMDLIRNIIGMKRFAPGQALDRKLIFIEPDIVFPLALNLFAVGKTRLDSYRPNEREAVINATADVLEHVFSALLDTPMTAMQGTIFKYTVRACMELPSANIITFKDLLISPKGAWRKLSEHFSPDTLEFFERLFDDEQFRSRRNELGWRLYNLLSNTTFKAMLAADECKLDLFTELQSSKVVVVHTNKRLIGDKQCEMFGRLFIALLRRAAEERTVMERTARTPTFVYIDECHDYIRNDTKIADIIEQCRKQNVGVILAHQRLTQLEGSLPAISNVAIKLANSDDEATVMAARLRAEKPSDVNLPVGMFLASIRDVTTKPIVLKVPGGVMEREPKATDEEQRALTQQMRERYCYQPGPEDEPLGPPPYEPEPPSVPRNPPRPRSSRKSPTSDPDNLDITPR